MLPLGMLFSLEALEAGGGGEPHIKIDKLMLRTAHRAAKGICISNSVCKL